MDNRVQTVINLFSSNLAKPVTLEQMAAHVHLSTSRLRHLFEAETGKTPARYLRSIRMAEARRLLATTFLSPKEIMFKVGIGNQSQFIRDFRQDSNMTPTQFRIIVKNLPESGGNGSTPVESIAHEKVEAAISSTQPGSGLSGMPAPRTGSGSELELTDEIFFRAFNEHPQPMTVTQLETGKFLFVNEAYLDTYGYTRDNLVGRTSLELNMWLSPDDRKRMIGMLKERGHINQTELVFRIHSGKIRVVLYSAKVLEIKGKQCIVSLTHDITDHKLAYDRLLLEKQKLEQQVSDLSARRKMKSG